MLTLRGIKYGAIFCAVGARGFAGEGYPFHKLWKWLGMDWTGSAFAGKTMTLNHNPGNMPLEEDGITPKEYFPKCIWGSPWNGGEMMNQVGLSNFGILFYLKAGMFYYLHEPFMISVMLQTQTFEERERELLQILEILGRFLPFRAPVALQINFACPNTGHDVTTFYNQVVWLVKLAKDRLAEWDVPVVANVNALMPLEVLAAAAEVADAIWIGNAIPFGSRGINWERFGVDEHGVAEPPLTRRNPKWSGGLSSPSCLPLTMNAVRALRKENKTIPIVAGNGIRSTSDIWQLKHLGADAVFIGSLAAVRPWRMRHIINYANHMLA